MNYLYENKSNPQSPKDIPVVNYVPSVTYGVGPELLVFKAAKKKKINITPSRMKNTVLRMRVIAYSPFRLCPFRIKVHTIYDTTFRPKRTQSK